MTKTIALTAAEIAAGHDRVQWAEGLIQQLPATHDGRNSWLINYGVRAEAQRLRAAWLARAAQEGRTVGRCPFPAIAAQPETTHAGD